MENVVRLKQRTLTTIILCAGLLMSFSFAKANPMDKWEPWVLEDHKQYHCPWVLGKSEEKTCIWPGKLRLNAGNQGATFTYTVDVYEQNAFVALPGNSAYWPKNVLVDGKPAALVERNELPYIAVSSGQHKVSGQFSWHKRPGQLAIPQTVAIVSLQIEGKNRIVDRRDGQLIFSSQSERTTKKTSDSLSIETFRLLNDGVPLTMITHISLSVSGKAREVNFGRVLLAGTELLNIRSPIPARLEADGLMRAQVTPGQHTIQVLSRFVESPRSITIQKLSNEWPEAEYISFKSASAIRQVKLSGPVSVDTSQISIPRGWRDYPTYRVGDGDALNIETEFRGDHSPGANEFNVKRDLWLDFNGEGITALDRISGEMKKDWRLNAAEGTNIGRATVDGAPVLITQDNNFEGIEVRSPAIELEAVTRTESTSNFSASGWNARADQYSATLHLPPGWRVLHASGVDRVWGTWLSQWDLWDVFLVLIIISATRKLISNSVAVLAGGAFLIALHEPGTPLLIIPILLIVIALLPLVSGKIHSMLRSVGGMLGVALALLLIAFAVSTFRLAIYPSLERTIIGTYKNRYEVAAFKGLSAPAVQAQYDTAVSESEPRKLSRSDGKPVAANRLSANKVTESLYQISENDRVQTGPGLPTWTWDSVGFRSSGPVPASQTLAIYYSTPLITSIWRVVSVFLVGLYAGIVLLRLARLSLIKLPEPKPGAGAAAILSLGLFALLGTLGSPETMAEDFPPQHLLQTLEKRLTKAPSCLPMCVSLNEGHIAVKGRSVAINFKAYADADIALPLPNGHGTWALEQVSEQGQVLPLRKGQDGVYVRLSKGQHSLEVKGTIIADQATISLPVAMHNISVIAPDWVVEGLIDGRVRNGTLTLRAMDKNAAQKVDTLKADLAPAFVRVKRHFTFGKKWRVKTSVQRISPREGAISLPIKLVPNEKLLKDMGAVSNGEIVVQLGHRQNGTQWVSSVEPSAHLQLEATSNTSYIEEWVFTPSSLWRLNYEGIPPIKADERANAFEPIFKPWPGEVLLVELRKPEGVPGATHTVENALLEVDTGNKIQRSTLSLEVRSSLGSNYTVTLPEEAEVLRFSVDGRAMNTPSGQELTIPLQPGSQSIVIEFQTLKTMGMLSHSPEVLLPDGATNVRVQYTLPRDRWPLYLSGPPIGPAMLYWGVLCVIVLGALALPRLAKELDLDMPIAMAGWLLLGIGLSTVNGYGVLIIAVMFFVLALRKQRVYPETMTRFQFNLMQCIIVGWVGLAVLCMVAAIPMGLLSNPEMKVVGNGSSSHFYNYYQDIVGASEGFPSVTVVSVPIMAYRAVMLLWSLWLSTQLIRWAGWAWGCFIEKTSWVPKTAKK